MICKVKIDDSFPDGQFQIKLLTQLDRNESGGGIMDEFVLKTKVMVV